MSGEAPRLDKGEWFVRDIPAHSGAVAMIEQNHYSKSCPNTSTFRHGLYSGAGELCGVALWIPPTKNAAATVDTEWRRVISLSRMVVVDGVPINGASFLLGRSIRAIRKDGRFRTLLTYADTAHNHTGAIYKATNWQCLGEVPAGDVWIDRDGKQRGRKRGRFTYTKAEMESMGLCRLPSLPKIKFVIHFEGR